MDADFCRKGHVISGFGTARLELRPPVGGMGFQATVVQSLAAYLYACRALQQRVSLALR